MQTSSSEAEHPPCVAVRAGHQRPWWWKERLKRPSNCPPPDLLAALARPTKLVLKRPEEAQRVKVGGCTPVVDACLVRGRLLAAPVLTRRHPSESRYGNRRCGGGDNSGHADVPDFVVPSDCVDLSDAMPVRDMRMPRGHLVTQPTPPSGVFSVVSTVLGGERRNG